MIFETIRNIIGETAFNELLEDANDEMLKAIITGDMSDLVTMIEENSTTTFTQTELDEMNNSELSFPEPTPSANSSNSASAAAIANLKSISVNNDLNNYNDPDYDTLSGWIISTNDDIDITGIEAPNTDDAKYIFNDSDKDIKIKHNDNSSQGKNRFLCPEESDFKLKTNCFVQIIYSTAKNRWLVAAFMKP